MKQKFLWNQLTDRGASMLEYSLIAALIGVVVIAGITQLRTQIVLTNGDAACAMSLANSEKGIAWHLGVGTAHNTCLRAHCVKEHWAFYAPIAKADIPNGC